MFNMTHANLNCDLVKKVYLAKRTLASPVGLPWLL